MVALTSHFQLFTTVYVLATTLLVDGAAVPARHMVKSSKLFAQTLPPVLPLPPAAIKNQNAEGVEGNTEKKFGPGKQQHKRKLSHLETRTNDRSNIGRRHNDRRENNDQTHRDSDHLKVGHSSSIVLSGGSYVISPSYARRSNRNNQQVLEVKGDHVHKHMTRDSNTTETIGMPGTIDVMLNSTVGQPIASLGLSRESTSNSTFVINAQAPDADRTTFYMIPVRPNVVHLAAQVFDTSTNTMNMWCATYNCSPPEPQSMTLQNCTNESSNSSETSQEFEYHPITGEVRPLPSAGQNNSTSDGSDSESDGNQAAAVPSSTGIANGTSVNSGNSPSGNNSSISARDAPVAQNVTLVFTPSVPTYSEDMSDSAADSEDVSSSITTTSTVTVTSTVSSTETDTITMTTTSGVDAPSNMASTASATTLPSPSDMDSSQAISSSSSVPQPTAAGALNVEVVGLASTPTDPGVLESTSSDSASTPPSSVNAEQIAASIAGSGTSVTTLSFSATATSTPVPIETAAGVVSVAAPMVPFST